MLGISFAELVIICIVIFLAVGPTRLAEASFHVGKWLGKLKEMAIHARQTHLGGMDLTSFYDAKTELNKSLKDLQTDTTTPLVHDDSSEF